MSTAPPPVASKLPDVGVTIFTVMTRLAVEHGAINLAQGFPDFDCDPSLVAAVTGHMKQGNNQYAPRRSPRRFTAGRTPATIPRPRSPSRRARPRRSSARSPRW